MNDINMVPFIDVMLVLLIIFMVTAPLITPGQIELPTVGKAARQPERFVLVHIHPDGQLSVRDSAQGDTTEKVNLPDLTSRIQSIQTEVGATPGVPVIIGADKTVPYARVIEVMDRLQRARITRVGLSVQPVP